MESSLFHAVVSRRDLPSKELFEQLETLHPGLFTDLMHVEGGEPYAKLALLYIIYAYSKESPLLVLGERYADMKRRIADFVELPDRMLGPVMQLQNYYVRNVVVNYLAAQKDRRWQHLCQDKEIYEAMCDNSLRALRRDDGSVDFKAIQDAAKYRRELLAQIELQEEAFKLDGEYGFVQENMEEIQKISKTVNGRRSLRLENSPHIK